MSKDNHITRHRKTEQDYIELARQRNFEFVGPFPANTHIRTRWRCGAGHEWEAAFSGLQGCPHCSQKAPKTPNDYNNLAVKRGFTWLGPFPMNVRTKTQWRCAQGHEWEAPYTDIQKGNGCSACNKPAKITAGDYAYLAEQLGIFWLGPMPQGSFGPTNWQCQLGHKFKRSYQQIKAAINPCPACKDRVNGFQVSRNQRRLNNLLNGELNYRVDRKRVDIAIIRKGVHIAIEYDAYYWHAGQEERDTKRDKYLISRGWRLLRIKSNYALPTLDQINAAIALLLAGETYTEIVLDDWGKGSTFHG